MISVSNVPVQLSAPGALSAMQCQPVRNVPQNTQVLDVRTAPADSTAILRAELAIPVPKST